MRRNYLFFIFFGLLNIYFFAQAAPARMQDMKQADKQFNDFKHKVDLLLEDYFDVVIDVKSCRDRFNEFLSKCNDLANNLFYVNRENAREYCKMELAKGVNYCKRIINIPKPKTEAECGVDFDIARNQCFADYYRGKTSCFKILTPKERKSCMDRVKDESKKCITKADDDYFDCRDTVEEGFVKSTSLPRPVRGFVGNSFR